MIRLFLATITRNTCIIHTRKRGADKERTSVCWADTTRFDEDRWALEYL